MSELQGQVTKSVETVQENTEGKENTEGFNHQSCSTLGPLITWISICLLTGKPSQYVPNHLGNPVFHPSVVGKLSSSLSGWGYGGVHSLVSDGR